MLCPLCPPGEEKPGVYGRLLLSAGIVKEQPNDPPLESFFICRDCSQRLSYDPDTKERLHRFVQERHAHVTE
jgi:hypothetical protein